ncbi:MAG: pyruvate kinase [Eubacteriales bacterium]|jgi:pyruvate kinase
MRRTKIVCTLGPASDNAAMLKKLVACGMNVARLNFSHGTHESHQKVIDTFKKVRKESDQPIALMLDTKGPEIRIKTFKDNQKPILAENDEFVLTTREIEGDKHAVSVSYAGLPSELVPGNRVLIDDGRICLEVVSTTDTDILCKVLAGGEISSRKGINIPYAHLEMPYLSEQDKADLVFGIQNDVDFVAASFVRCKQDVIDLRKFLDYHGGHAIKIISKIENIEGINNFDDILAHSDGIMVARGDMGVEVEYERLPGIQKKFIKRCYKAGKMVITATQMLESMIHNSTPTRAEITDVANAVFDGTSAVMLSGETAMGDHPDLVVSVMAKIVCRAETDYFDMQMQDDGPYVMDTKDKTNAICDAACTTARDLNAKAIIAVTKSGETARRVSKFRPVEAIVAATPELKTFHQLSLSWGVLPVLALNQDNEEKLFMHAVDCAKQTDIVSKGDTVVITAGLPLNTPGTTNLLKVETVR